jgi:hypothetical protein
MCVRGVCSVCWHTEVLAGLVHDTVQLLGLGISHRAWMMECKDMHIRHHN